MKNTFNTKKKLILALTIGAIFLVNTLIAQQLEVLHAGSFATGNKVNPPTKKVVISNISSNSKTAKSNKPNCMEKNFIKNNKSSKKKPEKNQASKSDEPVTSPASYTFNNSSSTNSIA
jgi:hypothetical protein